MIMNIDSERFNEHKEEVKRKYESGIAKIMAEFSLSENIAKSHFQYLPWSDKFYLNITLEINSLEEAKKLMEKSDKLRITFDEKTDKKISELVKNNEKA